MQLDGLESKFKLLSALPFDRRIGRKHTAVFAFILDWHHRKYGDALASTRFIVSALTECDPFGKGFYTGDVHTALTDLVSWGYLTQQKGSGRRASRYVPNWTVFDSVRGLPNTTADENSVLETPNTSVRETPNTTASSVLELPNEDPSTPTRGLDPGTGIDGDDCAAPLAPLAAGLTPAAAGTAQGGFEELWTAYAFRRDKSKARLAYKAIAPDTEKHLRILAAASTWRDAWAAQGKPDAPRKFLHVWLRDEEFECDPPTAFKPRERKTQSMSTARRSDVEATITGTEVRTDHLTFGEIVVRLVGSDGTEIEDTIVLQSGDDDEAQAAGQARFSALCHAIGLSGVQDDSELHGHKVRVSSGGDGYRYAAP